MTEISNPIDILRERLDEYLELMTSKTFIESIDFTQAEILIKFIETSQELNNSYEDLIIKLSRENNALKKCRKLDQYAEQQNLERNLKEKTDGNILDNGKFKESCRNVFNDLKQISNTNTTEDYKELSKLIRDSLNNIERAKRHGDIVKRVRKHQETLKKKL